MYNILRMDHEPEKRYDAQSEGASIFRPPPKKVWIFHAVVF